MATVIIDLYDLGVMFHFPLHQYTMGVKPGTPWYTGCKLVNQD